MIRLIKKIIFFSIIILLYFIVKCNATYADEENLYIKEFTSLDHVILSNDNEYALYGVSDQSYNDFINGFYVQPNGNESSHKFISFHYLNHDIKTDHENAIKLMNHLFSNKEIERINMNDTEVVINLKDICINEYIIEHGFAQVNTETVDTELSDKFNILQQNTKENNIGIWGTQFVEKSTKSTSQLDNTVNDNNKKKGTSIYLILTIIILIMANITKKKLIIYLVPVLYIFIALAADVLIMSDAYSYALYFIDTFVIICLVASYYKQTVNKKINFFFLLFHSTLFICALILVFANIYYVVSYNEMRIQDTTYDYPSLEQADSTEVPNENYVHIPEENYVTYQLNSNDFTQYEFSEMDAIYYSATTYFTVGYGDYYPCGFLKNISNVEMILAYIVNVFILGVSVNNYMSNIDRKKKKHNEIKTYNDGI